MRKKYILFTFKDNITDEVKYVGITKNEPANLLSSYKCASSYCERPLCLWLKDNRPKIEIVKETDDWEDRSKYISNISAKNSLLNVDKIGNSIYVEAGKLNRGKKKITKEKMIDKLCKFYETEGRFPVSSASNHRQGCWEYHDSFLCEGLNIPSIWTYIHNFGSYKTARDLAIKKITGDDNAKCENAPKSGRKPDPYRKERLIGYMIESKNKTGKHPHIIEKTGKWSDDVLNNIHGCSPGNYYQVFGNLTKLRAEVDERIGNE